MESELGDRLVFGGFVTGGCGKHSILKIPGRAALRQAPSDWPESLHPGSLNVRVTTYPSEIGDHGLANRIEELDKARFTPAFEIPQERIGNNTLHADPGNPRRGDAQVWRAEITVESDGRILSCWALRRFGSTVGQQLELLSDRRLREDGLWDGDAVQVTLFGTWCRV